MKLKKYIDWESKLEDDLQQVFDIIFGQCSPSIKQKLSGIKDFQTTKEEANATALLKGIEQICYNYQPHEFPPLSAWESLDRLG